jgi:predicted GNAT family acetyltransferase
MRFVFTRDAGELSRCAGDFLTAKLERNVVATVLLDAVAGRYTGTGELYVYGLDGAGEVAYAALRTPPWLMLTSELEPQHAPQLIELWLQHDPDLPGVNGVPATARAIAGAWAERTGGTTRIRMSDAMHALEAVTEPPRPAAGELRLATAADRPLLIEWMAAFGREAGAQGDLDDRAAAAVDGRLGNDGFLVWEDDADVVSVVGVSPAIAGTVRVGPVYTPPGRRSRGYASSAVAAASRLALANGAERCMLFTDIANPTSNKIYAEVGYVRFGDWEEHAFSRA